MEGQHQGGGEVRRLHIIYFLSRKGRIEHPHLIRVHHFSKNGIRLRDVKRWLGELRGKDMPESFAWSYKRKYKTGYVWQDLLDEDLITPISDNEYVLKGSEIPSTTHIKDVKCGEKGVTTTMQKEKTTQEDQNQDFLMDSSKKIPLEIEEEEEQESQHIASETSTLTTDSPKFQEEDEKVNNSSSFSSNSSSSVSSFGLMKTKKKTEDHGEKNSTDQKSEKTSKTPKLNKSRSYSNGASSIFRNLITCGAVDTNDSGIIPLKKNKNSVSNAASAEKTVSFSSEICKTDKIGGSQRIFGTAWNQQHTNGRKSYDGAFSMSENKNEFGSRRSVSANYKPINGPTCSQCGKPFKPEKLHSHMKSCKGMKALAKAANSVTSTATDKTSKDAAKLDSVSGNSLTH